jgi:hypothetical protein
VSRIKVLISVLILMTFTMSFGGNIKIDFPVKFGMSKSQVSDILGPPFGGSDQWHDIELWPASGKFTGIYIKYSNNKLFMISINYAGPGSSSYHNLKIINGIKLLDDIKKARRKLGKPEKLELADGEYTAVWNTFPYHIEISYPAKDINITEDNDITRFYLGLRLLKKNKITYIQFKKGI